SDRAEPATEWRDRSRATSRLRSRTESSRPKRERESRGVLPRNRFLFSVLEREATEIAEKDLLRLSTLNYLLSTLPCSITPAASPPPARQSCTARTNRANSRLFSRRRVSHARRERPPRGETRSPDRSRLRTSSRWNRAGRPAVS